MNGDYVLVPVTCPSCGRTENLVQKRDSVCSDPVKIGYLCPHCGWPETVQLEVVKPK